MRALALLLAALSIAPVEAATRRRIAGRGNASDSPFGVVFNNTPMNVAQIARAVEFAQTAGIQWIRVEFSWVKIQPVSGQIDFGSVEQIVARARDGNLRILGMLAYSPRWNTTAPAEVTDATKRERYPPADFDAWSRFVFTMVTTYKSSI